MSAQPSSSSPLSTGMSATSWVDSDGTLHERCKLLFYAEGKFLGEADFDPGDNPALDYRRGGVAFFCNYCGEVWGRMVLADSHGKVQIFTELSQVPCSRHKSQWAVSGSLLGGYQGYAWIEYLPEKALVREFMIHLNLEE